MITSPAGHMPFPPCFGIRGLVNDPNTPPARPFKGCDSRPSEFTAPRIQSVCIAQSRLVHRMAHWCLARARRGSLGNAAQRSLQQAAPRHAAPRLCRQNEAVDGIDPLLPRGLKLFVPLIGYRRVVELCRDGKR
jgi:hypothetical protein